MRERNQSEIGAISQLALVVTITVFSAVLIALNLLLGWEHWTVPLIVLCAGSCLAVYVMGELPHRLGVFVYAGVLLIEVFYYTVNAEATYDSTPVIVLLLVILAMTQESILPWIGFAVSATGVTYSLMMRNVEGKLVFDASNVIRTVLHIFLMFIALFVVRQLLKTIRGLERDLHRRIDILEEENRSASDFLTNVSHELRTPVNAVIGLTGLSIDEEEDPKKRERLSSIYEAGSRVAEQVGDIMDYSEIEMNRVKVNEEDYMFSSLLSDVNASLRPYLKPNLEVVFDVDMSLPSVMRSDVAKLKRIFWHLISNAIKFTREGGVYVHVSFETQPYGVNLNVEVTDTGIGMDMKEEAKSFRRFYQADSMRTRSSGGLGLGLPIVIGFLRELGGFLYVDSEPKTGSTFRVSIPQKVVDSRPCIEVENHPDICIGAFFYFQTIPNPQVREFYNRMIKNFTRGLNVMTHRAENIENLKRLVSSVHFTHIFTGAWEYAHFTDYIESIADQICVCVVADESLKRPKGTKVRLLTKPVSCFSLLNALNYGPVSEKGAGQLYLPGVRALVVDDEPMNLTVALGIFDKYEMAVTTATSGQEALDLCAVQDFDIVFMDHMMPGMDGVEAMKRIRAEARRKGAEFPIVALTANALSSAREMFLSEGFDAFVSKPVELSELERVLKKLLPTAAIVYRGREEKLPKEAPPGEEEAKADLWEELSALGIDPAKGMHYCKDDRNFYEVLLRQFAGEEKEKSRRADSFLAAQNLPDYAIVVHSVKSTARMIGADGLSGQALLAETAAKADDYQAVKGGHEQLFAAYASLAKSIRELVGEDAPEGTSSGSVMPQGAKMFEFLPKGK